MIKNENHETLTVKIAPRLGWIQSVTTSNGLLPIAVLVIVFSVFSIFGHNFFSIITVLNLLTQTSPLIILAIGETLVLLVGGIDLSAGSMTAFGGVSLVIFIQMGMPIPEAVLWATLVCGGIGLANGLLVASLRLPSFIITFAMAILIPGISKYFQDFMGYRPDGLFSLNNLPLVFRTIAHNASGAETVRFPGISLVIIIMIVLATLSHLLLAKTSYGRYVYLVGNNPAAAHLSGIKVTPIKILAFVFSSMMAGLTGVLISFQGGQPAGAAVGFDMIAIECAMIGGASIWGGTGSIRGTLIGCLIIGTLTVGLQMTWWNQLYIPLFINGFVLLCAVYLDQRQKKRMGIG